MVNRDNQTKSKDTPETMPAVIERPEMTTAMWSSMKNHIMKQREKKKLEQEADAAMERVRKEQEIKRKQDAMTLEEIKDQLARFEIKLSELKEEKHQLFLQLKKVLNEDETRRRAHVKETNEMVAVSHGYAPHSLNHGAPPPLYLHGSPHLLNRTQALYKVAMPAQQTIMTSGPLKRPRSASPPPQNFHQSFNFKTHNFGPKATLFPGNPSSAFYPHPNTTQITSTNPSSVVTVATPSATYSNYPSHLISSEPSSGAKHLAHTAYQIAHIAQQGFVSSLQMETANNKAGYPEEKYFVSSVPNRGVPTLATVQSVIPIQQPSKVSGGITSGYPVRTQSSLATSATHFQQVNSGPTQSQLNHPHNSFPAQNSRLAYPNQPNARYY